ncbi:MAG: HEAT repeat domain-containing protein, partial [Gammaproteobacteria bacterium]
GDRVTAIRWLARFGEDESVEVLERLLLGDTSSPIRIAIATALGECPHPDATRTLVTLLEGEDLDVVLGAIRGLAKRQDPGATQALTALLADNSQHDEVRSAAAAALGHHDHAVSDLQIAFASAEGELASGVLTGLALQPFVQTEPVFRELLADPDTPVDRKVEAIDALGDGTPEAAGLLLELAGNAEDPALRSAAIDALALFDEPGITLDALGGLVLGEPSAEVRADLYNTLSLHAEQANAEPVASELVLSTLSETMPRPQLEGYRMVASMLHDQYQPGLAATFDTSMVTWLKKSAAQGGDRYTRHLSIDALRLANTPGAQKALLDLSSSADPGISRSAQKALRLVEKTRVPTVP